LCYNKKINTNKKVDLQTIKNQYKNFASWKKITVILAIISIIGQLINSTTLTAKAQTHIAETVDVTVTNPDGQSTTYENPFIYQGTETDITKSIFSIMPTIINDQGETKATLMIVLNNSHNMALPGKTVQLSYTGPSMITFEPNSQNPEHDEWATNNNGQLILEISATKRGTYTFTATVLEDNAILNTHPTLTVSCAIGDDREQCLEIYIEPSDGELTLTIPQSFSFPQLSTSSSSQGQFSINDPGYNQNIITVTDTRNNGGFILQLNASEFADKADPQNIKTIPLENFYVATKASNTEGQRINGVEYNQEYDGELVIAVQDVEGKEFNIADTFTTDLTSNTLNGIVDIMDGSLETANGRVGTFKQIMQYYLNIPAYQQPGTYRATLTFDLIIL
jgi:hypothetical protein